MKRRNFVKTAGRLVLLGALGGSVAYLITHEKVSNSCTLAPSCENCGKFSACALPQAREIREAVSPQDEMDKYGNRPSLESRKNVKNGRQQ